MERYLDLDRGDRLKPSLNSGTFQLESLLPLLELLDLEGDRFKDGKGERNRDGDEFEFSSLSSLSPIDCAFWHL